MYCITYYVIMRQEGFGLKTGRAWILFGSSWSGGRGVWSGDRERLPLRQGWFGPAAGLVWSVGREGLVRQ
jgi:hypothetical protein